MTSVLAFVALSAACTSAQVAGPQASAGAPVGEDHLIIEGALESDTFVGNYLAGRHAQAVREGDRAISFFESALEKDPENADLNLRTGVLLVSEGQVTDAVPFLRRLPDGGSSSTVANFVLSTHDMMEGRFGEAAERLAVLPDNGINQFVGPLLKAWALLGMGDTAAALESINELADTTGAEALYDLHVGLIQALAGNEAAARRALLDSVSGTGAGAFRAVELVGSFLERSGHPDEAIQLYQRFLGEHPDSDLVAPELARIEAGGAPKNDLATAADGGAQALFNLAGVFRQQNAREMGLLFGQLALALKPDFPAAQILVGDILESADQPAAANEVYAKISKDSPFAWSARLRMALNLEQMDRPDDAVARLRELAAERPSDPEALITVGSILRGQERFEEAVEAYDEAIARIGTLEPRHWSVLYSRGMALERAKQWPRAEADFLKALEFEPDQPYVLNYLGYSWVDQGLHLERAMGMIEKAVDLRPNDGYVVDSLGWAHYRLGNMKDAVTELERAVELRPEDPIINDHLGDAYWRVGRHREARFQWSRSLGLDPEPDLMATLEDKLENGLETGTGKPGSDG